MADSDHKPDSVLLEELASAAKQITVGGKYRHYKNKDYTVLELATNEADNELYVVYRAEYGARLLFLRPVRVWLETVEVNGQLTPRFKKI